MVHHNCEQLIGVDQDLYISCKVNIEEKKWTEVQLRDSFICPGQ